MTDSSVISIKGLLKRANYLSRSDKSDLKKAFNFCYTAHNGRFRRTGDPYVSHPIAVAEICADWQLDSEALIAALLHDTVEDTNTSLKQIRPIIVMIKGDLVSPAPLKATPSENSIPISGWMSAKIHRKITVNLITSWSSMK